MITLRDLPTRFTANVRMAAAANANVLLDSETITGCPEKVTETVNMWSTRHAHVHHNIQGPQQVATLYSTRPVGKDAAGVVVVNSRM